MTLTVLPFNGTDGTPINEGNAGYKPGSLVLNGGQGILASAAASHGATGLEITNVAGLVANAKWAVADPSAVGADGVGEWSRVEGVVDTPTVAPDKDSTIAMLRSTVTGVILRLLFTATGTIYLQGAAGSTAKTLATAQPLGKRLVLSGVLKLDTTTTGRMIMLLLDPATRAVIGSTVTDNAYNLTTGPFDELGLGVWSTVSPATKHRYDTWRVETGFTGANPPAFLGAYTPPSASPPVVPSIAAKQVTTAETATYTAAASDPSGTVATSGGYQWRVISSPGTAPTLTNPTNAQVTVGTSATPGTVVLGVIATSSSGQVSAERTVNHYVSAVTGVEVNANRIVSNPGAWAPGGTATDLLDGTSDAGEWIQSPAGAKAAAVTVGGAPVPSTAAYVKVDLTLYKDDGVTLEDVGKTGAVTLQYFSGTTAVSDQQNVIISRTTTQALLTLTTAQNAALDAAGRWDPRLTMIATTD